MLDEGRPAAPLPGNTAMLLGRYYNGVPACGLLTGTSALLVHINYARRDENSQ